MLYAQLQDAAPPGPTDPRSIANADFALSGPGAGPGADGGETRGLKQLTTARGIHQQTECATQMLSDGRQTRSRCPGRVTGEPLTPPGKCRDVTKPDMHGHAKPGCGKPTWNLFCIARPKNAPAGSSRLSLLSPIAYAQGRWPQNKRTNFQQECNVGGCGSLGASSNSFTTMTLF